VLVGADRDAGTLEAAMSKEKRMDEEEEEPEDPRITLAEIERDDPEIDTGPDYEHQNYPDKNWGRE
jgi:hypothetical protein